MHWSAISKYPTHYDRLQPALSIFYLPSPAIFCPPALDLESLGLPSTARLQHLGAHSRFVRKLALSGSGRAPRSISSASGKKIRRLKNPPLPDRMGTICSLPRCLFFSFRLGLDAVHNCPYSNGNPIRYAPDPSPSFLSYSTPTGLLGHFQRVWIALAIRSLALVSCELTSNAFLLVCMRANPR
jgi:hypothetical protein